MLQKPHRIRKQKEFDRIYSRSKRVRTEHYTILIHFTDKKKKNQKLPRFGFVVSKKVGNAIVRNRTKRKMREIVRKKLSEFNESFEAIIIAGPKIVELDFHQLEESIIKSMQISNLFKRSK